MDATSPSPAAAPRIAIDPAPHARAVSPIKPVVIRASQAQLSAVLLTNPEGRAVRGAFSADRSRWTSAEPLGYGRAYVVSATARGSTGAAVRASSSFQTLSPVRTIFPSFFPPPSTRTVGVGQPLAVIFDKPVVDKAAAERALRVSTSPRVAGSWYWFDDRNVHWRPRTYWRAGTRVTINAKVYGVHLGGGGYGETDRTMSFTIGRSKIAVVNDRTHMMRVYVDGKYVRTIPVSLGRNQTVVGAGGKRISMRTQSGIHVVAEKYRVKRMTSASFGLPSNYSLGYDSVIPLAVRISNSGEFVHSAPWSVADQGRRNVSHGCVNLPPDAARWFYRTFSYGDVVDIRNTGVALRRTDGFADWNIPWSTWLRGSALR